MATTEKRVKDLGEGVYLADGKLIAAYEQDMFIGEDGRRALLAMAHDSFDRYKKFENAGWDTKVPIIRRETDDPRPGVKYAVSGQVRARGLPDRVKDALRKEFPQYA